MEREISKVLPGIDPIISEYAVGYLKHASTSTSPEAEAEFDEALNIVTSILVDVAEGDPKTQKAIAELIEELGKKLIAQHGNRTTVTRKNQAKRLDEAIHMASQKSMSATANLMSGGVDIDAVGSRKVESKVDKKKLEKAERKIKAKQDKKIHKNVEYEASKLIIKEENYDEFFMAVNPLELGNSGAGKSKDIKIDNVDVSISGKRILSDTSLTLAYGRRYGLVGQNGIGKSTLLRALSRRELPVPKHITILHVEQELLGDDTSAIQAVLDADVWRKHLLGEQVRINKRMAELDQHVPLPDKDEEESMQKEIQAERSELDALLSDVHAKLNEIDADRAESNAASILAGLGFSPERQLLPTKSFSGGWRMRLALARALFCKPDLLLLDEPSNMLDVPSITFLSEYLQTYPSTVLVVSHDRAFLNEVATDIIHQHSERLDYYKGGNFDAFYATKEERRKTARREYENQMAYRKHLQGFIDKFRYNAAKSSEAQSRIKKLEKLPVLEAPEEEYSVVFKFPEVEKLSPPIIQMTNVSFSYVPGNPIVEKVDLDVQLDSRIGIVGPNGAGKTTVLKLLIGALQPSSGMISQNARLRIGYFAQHHVDALDLTMSAVGFCAKMAPGKTDEEYRRHLGAFGITGTTGLQKMALLSGGQKSRVAFALLSLKSPHILVLDEPSNHLDVEAMDALADALRNFEGGVLMVSHDVTMIDAVCNRLWVCDNGTVEKFDGDIKAYKKRIIDQAGEAGVVKQMHHK